MNEVIVTYPSGCDDDVAYHAIGSWHRGHASRECAYAGIEPGWRELVDRIYDLVEPARMRGDDVAVVCVKQKWGELRISLRGAGVAPLRELAIVLRGLSRHRCEGCGAPAPEGPRDVLRGLYGFPRVRTYCAECYARARVGEPRKTIRRIKQVIEAAMHEPKH